MNAITKVSRETEATFAVPPIEKAILRLPIIGDSPLVCHKFSEKAIRQMLDKQMGAAKQAKEKKDPQKDFEGSLYPLNDGTGRYGFPAIGFKAAAVSACRFADGMKMTEARGAFHVLGTSDGKESLVPIIHPANYPKMRQDMVRVGMGTADVRFRGEFTEWAAIVEIKFNKRFFTEAQIINLFNLAGFGVGIGEGRPEKDKGWGMFHVADQPEEQALINSWLAAAEPKTATKRRAAK